MSFNTGAKNEESVNHTFVTWRKQKGWAPKVITGGNGCYFQDADGNSYLDMSSQLMCTNLGYGNQKIISAIKDQAEKLAYIAPSFDTEIREEVTTKLKTILPDNLEKYFFGTAGTEAIEAAIKIARMVKWKERKTKILSFYNSYHGSTLGSIQLTGDFRRVMSDYTESAPGFGHLPPPFCYRCPFGLEYPDCGSACAEYVDYAIKKEGNVAALVLEPVTGTNGVVVPPKDFLPRIREITEENGVFLIADEVMTGFCRTGEWFAVDHSKVKPDILTSAKGLTAAYTPLSLTAVNGEIADYFDDNFFAHGHTYEAHPLALSAASAAIDEYKRLDVLGNVRRLAPVFSRKLQEIAGKHQSVGEARSIGLFGSLDLVSDRDSRKPFNTYEDKVEGRSTVVDAVAREAMNRGVYVSSWISHFVIAPPLTIGEEDLLKGLDVIDQSLSVADSYLGK